MKKDISYEQYQELILFLKKLDDVIEAATLNLGTQESAFRNVFCLLQKEIGANGFYIEVKNEFLENTVYTYGSCINFPESIKQAEIDQDNHKILEIQNCVVFVQYLDIVGKSIGKVAVSFKEEDCRDRTFAAFQLESISDILDNYCLNVYISSAADMLQKKLQTIFIDNTFEKGLNQAIELIQPYLSGEKIFIVYADKQLIGGSIIHYSYYENGKCICYSLENGIDKFDRLVHDCDVDYFFLDEEEIKACMRAENIKCHEIMGSALGRKEVIGLVAREICTDKPESVLSNRLSNMFIAELGRSLVNFNSEQNLLRKNFSNIVVDQLINASDSIDEFLLPKKSEIGILFADISSFTALSEQALRLPGSITYFIHRWSTGVVKRVHPLGGCLDKLVGDCAIFLFGPPFYNKNREEIVKNLLTAAERIVDFTNNTFFPKIRKKFKDVNKFQHVGVAVGANLCTAAVGMMGPNKEFTAFSSGMNNTARLQGLAGPYEILVAKSVYDVAKSMNLWSFSEEKSSPVKNVKEPLKYYSLEHRSKGR